MGGYLDSHAPVFAREALYRRWRRWLAQENEGHSQQNSAARLHCAPKAGQIALGDADIFISAVKQASAAGKAVESVQLSRL